MRKFLTVLLAVFFAMGVLFAFAACGDNDDTPDGKDDTEQDFDGSEEEAEALTGNSYLLLTSSDEVTEAGVVFRILNPTEQDEDGTYMTIYCALSQIYINITVPDAAEWAETSVRLTRGSSSNPTSTSPIYRYTASLDSVLPENAKAGDSVWISPFNENLAKLSATNSRVATYRYMKLTAPTKNITVNEVVFVGEKLTSSTGERTGEYVILPVEIYSATPYNNQTNEEAKEAASAIIDAQEKFNLENFIK